MASNTAALSSFVESAPPGELSNVTSAIKTLTGDNGITASLEPALKKYNEKQFATVKLPGGSQSVIVSEFNQLPNGRYYDVESKSSWEFDHITQKASAVQSHVLESKHSDLIASLYKSISSHTAEHYASSSIGVYPSSDDSSIAILIVANKYSPSNFWNGRWRSSYNLSLSSSSLTGQIYVDVHYYEDGNVRLITSKSLDLKISSSPSSQDVLKQIAMAEKKYQEELNRGFTGLSEGAFKALRRQLPVTRQKMEWEKVGGYRVGQDIGGGRFK